MLDPAVLEAMRRRQYGAVLPEGETLPAALEEAYGAFSSALREVWRPNHELAVLVRKQRMELGLGAGGLRHRKHSPTWGGAQLTLSLRSQATSLISFPDRQSPSWCF